MPDPTTPFSNPTAIPNTNLQPAAPTPVEPPVNPLQKYFREPGMHITLPSKAVFYKNGEVELSINGELEVYPMTTGDELTLRSPDGMLNGDAVAKVIRSCCPGVKNVNSLVSPDVDAILLAIRSCTYGEDMGVDVECPECEFLNSFNINVDAALQEMSFLEEVNEVYLDQNIKVFLKPYSYENSVKATLAAFEETKLIRSMGDPAITDDQRIEAFGKSFKKLSKLNIELLVGSIDKIIIPESEVTDRSFIEDFVNNIEKKKIDILDKNIREINQTGANRKYTAKCTKCEHEWESEVTFDPAHFFE